MLREFLSNKKEVLAKSIIWGVATAGLYTGIHVAVSDNMPDVLNTAILAGVGLAGSCVHDMCVKNGLM